MKKCNTSLLKMWERPQCRDCRDTKVPLTLFSSLHYSNTRSLQFCSLDILRDSRQEFGVRREIQLSGGEIMILKAIGLTGTALGGKFLLDKIEEVEAGEFIDTVQGLLAMGYLLATKVNIKTLEDVERASFRVNPSYAHDLKDALDPYRRREQEKHRRRRRG